MLKFWPSPGWKYRKMNIKSFWRTGWIWPQENAKQGWVQHGYSLKETTDLLCCHCFQWFCCLSADPYRAGPVSTRTLEGWPVLSNTQWLPLSLMGHRGSSTPLLKGTVPICKFNGHKSKRIFSQEEKQSWSISYPSGHPEDPNPARPCAQLGSLWSILPCKWALPSSWWDCMWQLCHRPSIKHRAKTPGFSSFITAELTLI